MRQLRDSLGVLVLRVCAQVPGVVEVRRVARMVVSKAPLRSRVLVMAVLLGGVNNDVTVQLLLTSGYVRGWRVCLLWLLEGNVFVCAVRRGADVSGDLSNGRRSGGAMVGAGAGLWRVCSTKLQQGFLVADIRRLLDFPYRLQRRRRRGMAG
jgi:hypothetical protein